MQSNRPSLQARQPRIGLPSSPACTRLKRDAPFVEGHSRNQSQPIAFTATRPLRPHRPSISAPAAAVHVPRVSTHSGPHATGTTFGSRSKAPTGIRESNTSSGSESSASSFSFHRKVNSQLSSSTSLEDYFEPPKKSPGPDKSLETDPDQHEEAQHAGYFSIMESGDNIWNRVAAAASVLTVNVNKAWYLRLGTSGEEETALGRDSHLIRVMKTYHLAKARHPSDLPDWLFDERERKPSLSSRFTGSPRGAASDVQFLRPSALRHIYDNAASRAPDHLQTTSRVLAPPEKTGSSKAVDRLKAFRDAKRADLGVRHVSSKSESLSYSPRIHANTNTRHNDDHRGALSFPTRRPLTSAQPSQPGAF